MTTDRELLELAAKAAGIDVTWNADFDGFEYPVMFRQSLTNWERWNPLTDDGDALRLAVKLCIGIEIFQRDVVRVDFEHKNGQTRYWAEDVENDDPCAATRRAIVRAASEIGRAMG